MSNYFFLVRWSNINQRAKPLSKRFEGLRIAATWGLQVAKLKADSDSEFTIILKTLGATKDPWSLDNLQLRNGVYAELAESLSHRFGGYGWISVVQHILTPVQTFLLSKPISGEGLSLSKVEACFQVNWNSLRVVWSPSSSRQLGLKPPSLPPGTDRDWIWWFRLGMASYPSQWEVLEVDRRQCSCAAARQGLGVAGVWGKPWTCPPAKGRKTMEGYEPAGKSRLILSWLDYSEGPLQSLFVWFGLLTATRFQWKPSYGTHLQSNGFGGGTTIAVHVFPHAHAFEYFPPLINHLFAQLCEVNEHTAWLLLWRFWVIARL